MTEVNAMTNVILTLALWGIEREHRLQNGERRQFADGPLSPTDETSEEAVTLSISQDLPPATED